MALTNDLSARPETCNVLIQRTLGLNFMPFGSWPLLVKRGDLEVLYRFPIQKAGGKTASSLREEFSVFLSEVPALSVSPNLPKSRMALS
jgi:hypothetical protein